MFSRWSIWRLVEGACVMTELDWGDGMACWITTLVSWLGIRVLPSWWAPGPTMAPPTVLCIEIFCPEKTEDRGKRVRRGECFSLLSSSQRPKWGIWSCQLNTRVMASGKPWVHLSLVQLTATMRWKITIHLKRKAHKKIPGSSLITLPPSQWEVYIRDV